MNFYHHFIPNGATILQTLHSLHSHHSLPKRTRRPSNTPEWTEDTIAVFTNVKHALANASLLIHPTPDAPTSVMTDASDVAVGAVLQHINGLWCPLAFFSRALKPAETRYSTYDPELLAIYLAIKCFRYFLERRDFHMLTDHKPLIYALSSRLDRHSPRQIHHLDFISHSPLICITYRDQPMQQLMPSLVSAPMLSTTTIPPQW